MQTSQRGGAARVYKTALPAALAVLFCCAPIPTEGVPSAFGRSDIPMTENGPGECGIHLDVTGAHFAPDFCRFEIISGGAVCRNVDSCGADYALNFRARVPAAGAVQSMVLFNLRSFETGTYTVDPSTGEEDFKGELIDGASAVHSLLRGRLTLDRQAGEAVHVSFDLHFANDISVRGTGTLDVEHVSAPAAHTRSRAFPDQIGPL